MRGSLNVNMNVGRRCERDNIGLWWVGVSLCAERVYTLTSPSEQSPRRPSARRRQILHTEQLMRSAIAHIAADVVSCNTQNS